MKSLYSFLLAIIYLIIFLSTDIIAGDIISFKGKEYVIGANTILLDKENIYNNPQSVKNPEQAFEDVNRAKGKVTLLVAPSVYWLDDPDDPEIRTDKGGTPFAARIECDTLEIIGLSDSPQDVVFAVNRGQTQGAVGNFTMFHFSGNSLTTENITFGNYCNVDLDYPRNPLYNRSKRKDAIVQAQIGICSNTDKLYADNCRFISRLNLCPFVGARRSLYKDCYFECTDDALSGSAVYLDCSFTFFSSKPFYSTSETGAVFINCDIKSLCSGTQYFTKVPGQVTVIDTRFQCDNPIEIQWTRDLSDIICYQHNVSLNGKPYTIDAERPVLWQELTAASVKDAYITESNGKSLYNLPNILGGLDGWFPLDNDGLTNDSETDKNKLTHTGLPVNLRVISDKTTLNAKNDTAHLTATPILWGGYPSGESHKHLYVSNNSKPEIQKETVEIEHPCGLSAKQTISVLPLLRKAPKFKQKPIIKYDSLSKQYRVSYKLSGKGDDESSVAWGRIISEPIGENRAILLKQENAGIDCGFTPRAADLGCDLVAVVIPKYRDSESGEISVSDPIHVRDMSIIDELPESTLSTDFRTIPISKRSPGLIGAWSFDVFKPFDTRNVEWKATDGAGWYFGKGFDASTSEGLVQMEKGARLSYLPERDSCKDMSASLIAEPAKSGGQGFGSATTQYMDICVKFNPVTLDGYALRIERTPEHDRAVRFSLIRYDKGETSVLNEGVISNCFRTPCKINVSVKDGILRAQASTEAPNARPCCDETIQNVDLSAPVDENAFTGFCIQHTGSTGPSSTLIRKVDLKWDH